jgi:hypothetical protein
MRNLKILMLIAMAILTAGCVGTSTLTEEPRPHIETETQPSEFPSATRTVAPDPTPTLQITATTLQPSPSSTITPVVPPEARLTINCLDVALSLPPDVTSEGFVILDSRVLVGFRYLYETFMLNMATGEKTQIAEQNESLINFAVSPDRRLLAYERGLFDKPVGNVIEDDLVIMTADAQPLVSVPWEDGWVGVAGWLDNERLIINIAGMDPDENAARKPYSLMLLHPFTGERQILRPEFPNIYDFPPVPHWQDYGLTVYDPTLKLVVYLRGSISEPLEYTLWDIAAQQELAAIDIVGDFPVPRWSPDGKFFAVAPMLNPQTGWPDYELYSVSREGQIARLTNITAYHPWIFIEDFSWSPDGHSIAFWLTYLSEKPDGYHHGGQQLAVLDTRTGDVTDYCVPGHYDASRSSVSVPPPLWSPNGQQLIVVNRYAEKNARRVILVDLTLDIAVQIDENMEPVGWISAEP